MARPKKQNVERGVTGKIKTAAYAARRAAAKEETDRNAADVAKWARMAFVIRELGADARLASVCGRMLLIERPKRISAREFEASVRLAGVLDDYDRLVLGVKRAAQAQDVNKAVGLSCGSETPQAAVRRASAAWVEAQGVMGLAGPSCASATMAMIREEAWQHRLDDAIAGLRALVAHWKLNEVSEPRIKRAVEAIFSRAA